MSDDSPNQTKDETNSDIKMLPTIKTSQENNNKFQQVMDGTFEQGAEIESQLATDYDSPRSHDEGEPSTLTKPKKKPSSWSVLLKAFREVGLPSSSSPDTWLEFGALKKLLYDPKVIVITTKILNVGLKIKDDESRQRARILLTSYMTIMCPYEVLQNVDGDEEKRLHISAQRMLFLFETWLSAHGRPGATAARLRFVDAWNDYFILFEAWKSRDRDQLVNSMIAYYLELLSLKSTTKKGQESNEDVDNQLFEQLAQVELKIKELGGAAAIASLKRAIDLAQQLEVAASRSTERRKQSTPRSSDIQQQQSKKEEKESYTKQLRQALSDYAPSSVLNEQIAHELIMDPSFKLTRPSSKLEVQVRETMEKAYFDKIAEDVEQGIVKESLLPLLGDIRERLLSLVRPEGYLHQNISDVLDLPFIEQQVRQKSFDINGTISFILDTMSKICAPVRDEEIQKIRSSEKTIEKVRGITKLLDGMNLDLANFRLLSLRPHLVSIAVEYERDKFAEMLNNGDIQLLHTTKWLENSVCEYHEESRTKTRPSHISIFENAFISLISQSQPISVMTSVPETFRLDKKRLTEYQNEMQAITIIASLILLVKNFGCANDESFTKLAGNLFTLLEHDNISIEDLTVEIERAVNDDSKRSMIRTMVNKTISHTDTIYLLLFRRVVSVIKSTIQSKKFVTDTVISSYSLHYVRERLEDLAKRVLLLSEHNQKVDLFSGSELLGIFITLNRTITYLPSEGLMNE
ncbi:Tcp11-domain-containing protein [Backusella circina FSU 941]|nr:Tcp11-domain-containing protein [Backusella circina FSU 941]